MASNDGTVTATHALNNELATILGTAQLALRELVVDGALTPTLGDDLTTIIDASRRAARLVTDLQRAEPPIRRRRLRERL